MLFNINNYCIRDYDDVSLLKDDRLDIDGPKRFNSFKESFTCAFILFTVNPNLDAVRFKNQKLETEPLVLSSRPIDIMYNFRTTDPDAKLILENSDDNEEFEIDVTDDLCIPTVLLFTRIKVVGDIFYDAIVLRNYHRVKISSSVHSYISLTPKLSIYRRKIVDQSRPKKKNYGKSGCCIL